MFTIKHKIESIFLITIAGFIGLFFAVSVNKNQLKIIPTMIGIEANSIPTPFPTEIFTVESSVSEISSDGSKKVILRKIQKGDKTQIVTVSTQDGNGDNGQVIFSKSLQKDKSMSIPYNTWSPDNKYFFIQENTATGSGIMVFNSKGESFGNGEAYLDLTGLFEKQETGNNFSEATGWASETLIIVNAATKENTKVSYWFEVPSKAIIQLSTVF
jgi:hypothetical protein